MPRQSLLTSGGMPSRPSFLSACPTSVTATGYQSTPTWTSVIISRQSLVDQGELNKLMSTLSHRKRRLMTVLLSASLCSFEHQIISCHGYSPPAVINSQLSMLQTFSNQWHLSPPSILQIILDKINQFHCCCLHCNQFQHKLSDQKLFQQLSHNWRSSCASINNRYLQTVKND